MKKGTYLIVPVLALLFAIANFNHSALAAAPAITNISVTPNPFNPNNGPCKFSYTTSDADSKELFILLQIYNQYDGASTLRHISQKFQPTGANYLLWDGKDDNGNLLKDGTYKYYFYVDDHPDGVGPGNYVFSGTNYTISISGTGSKITDITPPVIKNISFTPNPFDPKAGPCRFSYTTSDDLSQKLYVVINILNIDTAPNKNVAIIIREAQPAGDNIVLWEGYDTWDGTKQDYGNLLPSGKYSLHGYISDEAGNKAFFGSYGITLNTSETPLDKTIHKGWPKAFTTADLILYDNISPVIFDLDKDGKKEIIVGGSVWQGQSPAFRIHIFHEDGTVYPGWPVTIGNGQLRDAVSVGDIAGDSSAEIIAFSGSTLYIFSSDGNPLPLFNPYKLPASYVSGTSPILFDIDNDGKKEIILKSVHDIYVLKGTGDLLYKLPITISNDWIRRVSVGFINKKFTLFCITGRGYLFAWDNKGEISESFPKKLDFLPNDLSIINISQETPYIFISELSGNKVVGLKANGDFFGRWPYSASFTGEVSAMRSNNLSFIKINNKLYILAKFLDLVYNLGDDTSAWKIEAYRANRNVKLYLFDISGNLTKGWPITFSNSGKMKDTLDGERLEAVSADIDGDGNEEIIIGNQDFNEVHAFKLDGTESKGWPKRFSQNGYLIKASAIGDIDDDGKLELVGMAGLRNPGKYPLPIEICVWDLESVQKDNALTWPQYRHDAAHTGLYAPSYREKREMPPVPGTPDFGDLSRESRLWGKYSLSWREAADDNETGFRDYWNYVLSLSDEDRYGGYQYSDSDEEEGLDLLKGYWDSYLERLDDLLVDLKEYEVYRNGKYVASVMRPNYAETGLPEGKYDYYVKALDRYGNASEPSGVSSNIIVDRTPPVISDISAPKQFDPERGLCKIAYAISDNFAKELFVLLEIAQKPKKQEPPLVVRRIIQNFQPAGQNYLFWDGRDDSGNLLERGEYLFRFYVSDENGINLDSLDRMTTVVSEERQIRLHKDEGKKKAVPLVKPPEIIILSPENNFLINKPAITVNYTVDGITKYNDFILQEGQNTLTVSGTNAQGIPASKSIQVRSDTKPPQISINSPVDNFITEEPDIIIEYTVDGEAKSKDYVLQEGTNIVTVQESDAAGNSGSDSINVTLNIKAIAQLPEPQPQETTSQPQEAAGDQAVSAVQAQQQPPTAPNQPEPVVQKATEKVKPKPKAVMIALPRAGYAPLEVRFFGDRSFGRGGNIVSYSWNFGDGATSNEINPVHVFENSSRYLAVYRVSLTVTDDNGISATARTKVRALRELKK